MNAEKRHHSELRTAINDGAKLQATKRVPTPVDRGTVGAFRLHHPFLAPQKSRTNNDGVQ